MEASLPELTLKERIKLLPSQPGVYRFLNKDGVIIYIGKAKNLKNRVSQYFHSPETLSAKTRVMVSKIVTLEHTVVESEEDALLLENNLIKEYQPRYNVMLKDGKTYPWICIKNETFPRVYITRKKPKDGSTYFGPYSAANQAHSLIELISNLFYIRDCKLDLSRSAIENKRYRPCLKFHIGKCKAPCVGKISESEYNSQIDKITAILRGDSSMLVREFREKMQNAASELKFEEAQVYKDKMELLANHNSKSVIVSQSITNVDVFSLVFENNLAFGNYIRIINGGIIQSSNMELKMPIEESEESILSLFITDTYAKFGDASGEIIVPFLPDAEHLSKRSLIPKRGDKFTLLNLSLKNAIYLKRERIKQEQTLRPEEHYGRVLDSMRKELSMKALPSHIECFDNSNIQGKYAVAACVVFKNGVPSKNDYRHFNIKRVVGANDFATMKEVINRRYSRLLAENGELPQLIVVDGGRGQLNFAWEALRELGLESEIKIIGIAKRLEELIIPGDPHPLFLDKNSVTLRVIMHLRDEAHRFGITHHRNKRSKGQIDSELRSISGLGTKSEEKLLKSFRSVAAIKRASFEDLEKVAGKRVAVAIVEHFGRASTR
ncbi:MAG: excinuclease ABC subunit UvrC [Bacteroidales bacterium]